MSRDELMEIPEYKAYIEAHPTEWIDDLIRNRLMEGELVPMPSEGIWLWTRITERFNEKFDEWLLEKYPSFVGNIKESNYEASLQYESVPPKRDPVTGKEYRDGASWIFSLIVRRKEDTID